MVILVFKQANLYTYMLCKGGTIDQYTDIPCTETRRSTFGPSFIMVYNLITDDCVSVLARE